MRYQSIKRAERNSTMFEITTNQTHYISKQLEKATQRIYKLSDSIGQNMFAIAFIIADVADEMAQEIENADGFASVHEWTEKAFGFKKSMSYNMLNVGRRFTAQVQNGKTKTYRDSITQADEKGYTITQCIQFLPYLDCDIEELHKAGTINPDMTCKELAETLKKYLKAPKAEPEEAEPENDEEAEVYTTVKNEHEDIEISIPQKVWDKLVKKYGGA